MFTTIITHPACINHRPPAGHPECSERLIAVLAALEAEEFAYLPRVEAPLASVEMLTRLHDRAHVDYLLSQIPASGTQALDADTHVSPGSGEAALRAAGAVAHGVELIVNGQSRTVFCAVRPPGHHAEPERAMGFCLFNNIGVGVHQARAMGLKRLAVIDFDVHHGNGTQRLAESDSDLFFASTHQWPLYPGTGRVEETGPADNILNVPLKAGCDSDGFREAFAAKILPALTEYAPEMIFISAGFDAHWRDPLGGLDLNEHDFGWATTQIVAVAEKCAKGRVLSSLEGGYDLDGLARSTVHHVRGLMGV
jgi:acetoin utilization deacetylase AcuC-like enzyme